MLVKLTYNAATGNFELENGAIVFPWYDTWMHNRSDTRFKSFAESLADLVK